MLSLIGGGTGVTAASAEALVALGTAANPPYSDGHQVLWSGGPGWVQTLDPATGRRGRLQLPTGCRLRSAASGVALIPCVATADSVARTYVLNTSTGLTTPLDGVFGPVAVGAQWVEYVAGADCYHCDVRAFRNWHTGEERRVDGMDDRPYDRDSARFRGVPLDLGSERALIDAVARGPQSLVAWLTPRGSPQVALVEQGRARVLGRCAEDCNAPLLTSQRAAWIDLGRQPVLRTLSLASGARRSWPLPHAYADRVRLLAVGRNVVVAQPRLGLGSSVTLLRADF